MTLRDNMSNDSKGFYKINLKIWADLVEAKPFAQKMPYMWGVNYKNLDRVIESMLWVIDPDETMGQVNCLTVIPALHHTVKDSEVRLLLSAPSGRYRRYSSVIVPTCAIYAVFGNSLVMHVRQHMISMEIESYKMSMR